MIRINSDGSYLLGVDRAPTEVHMPLFSIVAIGTPETNEALKTELRNIEETSNTAWDAWVSRGPILGWRIEYRAVELNDEPRVLCVLLVTDDPASVLKAREALEASSASTKFLMFMSERLSSSLGDIRFSAHACFISTSLTLLLNPLRWVTIPHGLVGIDLDDYMTVCRGRWIHVTAIGTSGLKDKVMARLPLQGLILNFGGMRLAELDALVTSVKTELPDHVDFVWHDASWRHDRDVVEAFFGYENPTADFCSPPALRPG